jgi:hypothetical protein
MKNCIFISIFNDENYVKLVYLFLESLYISNNNLSNIDILIYTSTKFMNIIKNSYLFSYNIFFEINDNDNDNNNENDNDIFKKILPLSLQLSLKFFNFKLNKNYQKIIFMDINTIIKGDINTLFDIITNDILYVFPDNNDKIFIVLFNNNEKIKTLFSKINNDYKNEKIFDNKKLKLFITNNNFNIYTDFIVYHFSLDNDKDIFNSMNNFLNNYKNYLINKKFLLTKKYININENYSLTYTNITLYKVKNISGLVLNLNIYKIMEIGFNTLFYTFLMLFSNSNVYINYYVLNDIEMNNLKSLNIYDKIKELFNNRINFLIYNDINNLNYNKYDLIHINGLIINFEEIITNINTNCKKNTIIIIDNYNNNFNNKTLWDSYVSKNNLKNLDINKYFYHDIKYIN